jgi:uncharacterized protein (TIGR03435 family)
MIGRTPSRITAIKQVVRPRPAQSDKAVGPSTFTAIQEQLGLKLEPTKRPVEALAIRQRTNCFAQFRQAWGADHS